MYRVRGSQGDSRGKGLWWGIDRPRAAATWRVGEDRWELRPELVRASHRYPYLTH